MTESEIPQELIEALQKKEKDMKHNWMYSFMPSGADIYLVGYCKVCDTSVASFVSRSFKETTTTKANIPKWGCVPIQELDQQPF